MEKTPARLNRAAARFRDAQAELGAARDELHAAIVAACADRYHVADVARVSGYDREHVRRIRKAAEQPA